MLHNKENVIKKPKCLSYFSGYTNMPSTIFILSTEDWHYMVIKKMKTRMQENKHQRTAGVKTTAGQSQVWLPSAFILNTSPADTKNNKQIQISLSERPELLRFGFSTSPYSLVQSVMF